DHEIGSIEKGKAADLIAVNLESAYTIPVSDPATQILYSADRENITHTWVNGCLIATKVAQKEGKKFDSDQNLVESVKLIALKWQNKQ
ncbi:MAG: amidohydrolase family protein, partial [Sutterella sp.]